MRLLLLLAALGLLAKTASGHGCGWEGPRGRWVRGIPCECAEVGCPRCTANGVREGEALAGRITKVTELKRWGDIAHLRVTVTFQAKAKGARVEGYAEVRPAPIFAAVTGRLEQEGRQRPGRRQPDRSARRIYLFEKKTSGQECMLVRRKGPGTLDLRVARVRGKSPTVATIEGFAYLGPPRRRIAQLYRTGSRYFAVVPTGKSGWSMRFLSEDDARAQFCCLVARTVPCVPELEAAASGVGRAAASRTLALAAFRPGARPAPFVGEDYFAPDGPPGSSVPPWARAPIDPPPPPPPAAIPPKPPAGS